MSSADSSLSSVYVQLITCTRGVAVSVHGKSKPGCALPQVNGANSGSSSGDDSDDADGTSGGDADDMDTDEPPAADSRQRPQPRWAPPPPPVVDDDGFQLVQRKGRR